MRLELPPKVSVFNKFAGSRFRLLPFSANT